MRRGLVAVLLSLAACAPSDPSPFESGAKGSDLPPGGQLPTFGDKDGWTAPAIDCPAGAELVYVVSQENDLYAFTPDKGRFQKIGRLSCPAQAGSFPNSMAIDRQGYAWVNYTSGQLFRVSTNDATCTTTSFKPNQAGFLKFAMAFATDGADSKDETLYISGLDIQAVHGKGIGKIDLKTMELTMLDDGSSNFGGAGAELTGTGDGRLFGLFMTRPSATLAQIDKEHGAASENRGLDGLSAAKAFAFAFWGGDFWFFTADDNTSSRVTQLRPTGELVLAKENVGEFRIVGASVSTCAPKSPPK